MAQHKRFSVFGTCVNCILGICGGGAVGIILLITAFQHRYTGMATHLLGGIAFFILTALCVIHEERFRAQNTTPEKWTESGILVRSAPTIIATAYALLVVSLMIHDQNRLLSISSPFDIIAIILTLVVCSALALINQRRIK